jgi:hypothetical protein
LLVVLSLTVSKSVFRGVAVTEVNPNGERF